jgi:hypothetical protein
MLPAMEVGVVTCPSCFETFEVVLPDPDEVPAEVDYDCEICCRPMLLVFTAEDDGIWVEARGLGD